MKTYRVAILGCNLRGQAVARGYHLNPRTEIVAVCDRVREHVDTVGDKFGVRERFADLDEMITTTTPDIVAIPTGTDTHYDLCMRVLEHGVHVDVEKPMCLDLEQADAIMAKANEKGVRVAVHHQRRCGGLVRAAKQALDDGRIGELRFIAASGRDYYAGLALMNCVTHTINDILHFAGHCRAVTAEAWTDGRRITPADVVPAPGGFGLIAGEHITATLYFDHAVTALVVMHCDPEMAIRVPWIELHGSRARLRLGWEGVWRLGHFGRDHDPDPTHWERLDGVYPDGLAAHPEAAGVDDCCYVQEFVDALDQGRDHACGGERACHVIEVLMGVFESAAYGTRVDLPQGRRDQPLARWRREHGLGDPGPMPREYGEWLAAENRRLGRAAQGAP